MKSSLLIRATVVDNRFIDEYMAAANGEYVKVYLYILRHGDGQLTLETIADALNHTEADVRRALTYWKKQGVLADSEKEELSEQPKKQPKEQVSESPKGQLREQRESQAKEQEEEQREEREKEHGAALQEKAKATSVPETKNGKARTSYTPDQVGALAQDEDFAQLLYIAQKYMNKVFTPRDCEVFAYLYDGLHMSMELLEYLVEYCVQGGHSSLRYLETVALDWHEKGIREVEAAKIHASAYKKDTFTVMRAFGLNDRKPGEAETELIERWFKEYGFTKEIVVEACNRTLAAIHNPSFQYADKILSEWKKAGVKSMGDIRALDKKRENRSTTKQPVAPKTGKNQFHNFEQRETNYDAMVLERLKERLGEQ